MSDSASVLGDGDPLRRASTTSVVPPPHFPVQIEGMAHQGMGLGPPGNLHDRVVFVSNVSFGVGVGQADR
jgi:hypothetical protein